MGFAKDSLPSSDLAEIARSLFTVTSEEPDKGEIHGLCPIHGEKNPSFSYNYKKDAYSCFSCQAKGDIIDLWCLVNGHADKKEGFKAFLEKFGLEVGQGSQHPPRDMPATEKTEDPPSIIPEDIWQKMPLLPDAWINRLQETRGWSSAAIKELDLRVQTFYLDKKTKAVKPIHGQPQRIAMPVRDSDNKNLLNIRLYKPDAKIHKIISWGKGYGKARLYPSPALLAPDGPVYLCEGEADTNCARSNGFNAITQTSKLVNWPQDHIEPFRDRDVIICYDADQAGQKYARYAAENLIKIAKSVRLLEWPEYMGRLDNGEWPENHGQDLTDFFVRHKKTVADFQAIATQAEHYIPQEEDEDSAPSSREFFEYNVRSGRYTFKPRWLANRILQDVPLMFDPKTGLIYKWGGKYWEDYFEENIKKRCIDYLQDDSTTARISDATTQAILLSTIPTNEEINGMKDLICINNGMLNMKDLTIKKHDQDYYCTYQLDVDFNADSDRICGRWLDCLSETIQTKEPIMQVQEFFGYCLTRDTKYAKALFAIGPGADGKSTMLKILRKMCGPQNCAAVSFRDMEDQFYRSAIYNKLLNISTEVGSRAMESQYFKAIVTGDPIMAAFKNQTPFEFLPFCKLAFAANKLPRVLDNSDGFFRRVLPVSFKRQFLGQDRDNSLEQKLEAELSEIFSWSLVGLHRLWEQDGFTWCNESDELLLGYKRLNNPVLCFVEDICHIGSSPEFKAEKIPLYKKYKNYCKRRGYTQLHYQNFFRELKTAVSSLADYRPREDGERKQYVRGIMINEAVQLEDDDE